MKVSLISQIVGNTIGCQRHSRLSRIYRQTGVGLGAMRKGARKLKWVNEEIRRKWIGYVYLDILRSWRVTKRNCLNREKESERDWIATDRGKLG